MAFWEKPKPLPVDPARAALQALVAKLDEILNHPEHHAVYLIAHVHRGPYRGPNFKEELAVAKAVLEQPFPPSTPE